jgi:hypothetical protein
LRPMERFWPIWSGYFSKIESLYFRVMTGILSFSAYGLTDESAQKTLVCDGVTSKK